MPPLRIGMIGCGTVGQSVLNILRDRAETLTSLDIKIEFVKIAVGDPSKPREYIPEGAELVGDAMAIINDDTIDTVVEVMGGTGLCKDLVYAAIAKGKNIITANKALLAECLPEILEMVAANKVQLGYEAAVCGGIPIIHTLQKDYLGDEVQQICGIMNGTTNFMLSKMEAEGVDYANVLKEAQDLGFAEADPTADVGGFDVRAKIALLARLGFGTYIDCEDIPTDGITEVSSDDFMYAKHLKATIKLLGVARMSNDVLTIMVAPHLVPHSNPIASINGATNIVNVISSNLGSSFFVGQGAGGLPTANSVISDILAMGQGQCSTAFPKTVAAKIDNDFVACFYMRFKVKDQVGIIKCIADACWKYDISIGSIEQVQAGDRSSLPFVVTTEKVAYSKVKKVISEISTAPWNVEQPVVMPMLE